MAIVFGLDAFFNDRAEHRDEKLTFGWKLSV